MPSTWIPNVAEVPARHPSAVIANQSCASRFVYGCGTRSRKIAMSGSLMRSTSASASPALQGRRVTVPSTTAVGVKCGIESGLSLR
jgi:hypothetical protein